MVLPTLPDWGPTRTALHQAAQVIGGVRTALADPEPNWGHLGLRVVPDGLTTGVLPSAGELVLDFRALTILYRPTNQEPLGCSLVQHNQKSLADTVEQMLVALGKPVTLKRDKITSETTFDLNADLAADYARVLFLFFEILRRFREGLLGEKSRLVVWPHGFDLSFLWFVKDSVSEQEPHMAFGFSPSSAGLERPYLYSNRIPSPLA
jgi:hypothetical protein